MRYLFYLIPINFLFLILSSCCSSDEAVNNEKLLIGIWTNDTGEKYLEGTELLPIISQIHFKESLTFDMVSLNFPDSSLPIFIKPDFSGKWRLIEKQKLIEFTQLYSFGEEFDKVYYWEIIELTESTLHIKILDQNKSFLDQRVFIKEK